MRALPPAYKDRHAGLASNVVLPLIGEGVPMQFAHAAGLHADDRRGDIRCREFFLRDDAHLAPAVTLVGGMVLALKT